MTDLQDEDLFSAAESGDVDKVRELLQQGKYDVNCTDYLGRSPLYYACKEGHLNVVRALVLEFEADVNLETNLYHGTPLHVASKWGAFRCC